MNDWYDAAIASLKLERELNDKRFKLSLMRRQKGDVISIRALHKEIIDDEVKLDKLMDYELKLSRKVLGEFAKRIPNR